VFDDREGRGDEAKADGFNPDGKQLYIDPEECIDCGACEPECPVEAIFEETEVPYGQEHWVDINEEKSQDLPIITDTLEPLEGAEEKREKLGL
jgi:ferredoxin